MPALIKLVVQNFRNIELQEINFSRNINCISGGNGQGKTNLLDAIHYLSMTKSALSSTDKFNFRHGTKEFALSGVYSMPSGTTSRFSIKVCDNGEKTVKRDDKQYAKISEHIGVLPVVMVSPSDISLVSESGEQRRRFVNSVLSQMDPEYLSSAQKYTRLLAQRNTLLKERDCDPAMLDAIDPILARTAGNIYESRKRFVSDLEPRIRKYYEILSDGKESIGVSYESDLDRNTPEQVLSNNRQKDLLLHYTTAGVQRDDFVFTMDGFPIRKCGSQGQQKSFVVALKFAQYEYMRERLGCEPILLMDDLFDKLDMTRVQNLLKMVSGNNFGQIFISDSNKVRISGIVDGITSERSYFETCDGKYTVIDGQ